MLGSAFALTVAAVAGVAGERPVRVTARIKSGSGRAIVDVERVEISGVKGEPPPPTDALATGAAPASQTADVTLLTAIAPREPKKQLSLPLS